MKITLKPKSNLTNQNTDIVNLSNSLASTNISTPESSPFYKQYYALQQFYEQKFGPKTVVVMQKGVTYEIYE